MYSVHTCSTLYIQVSTHTHVGHSKEADYTTSKMCEQLNINVDL